MLQHYLSQRLDQANLPRVSHDALTEVLEKVAAAAARFAASKGGEQDARLTATALYNVTSAILLGWEASRIQDDWRRLALAHLVIVHKLLPRDPLAPSQADANALRALLSETPMGRDQALRLLRPLEGVSREQPES